LLSYSLLGLHALIARATPSNDKNEERFRESESEGWAALQQPSLRLAFTDASTTTLKATISWFLLEAPYIDTMSQAVPTVARKWFYFVRK